MLLFSEAEGLLTKHLGPEAVHLGANARSFRKPFSVSAVRQVLLAGQPKLLASTGTKILLVGGDNGLALPLFTELSLAPAKLFLVKEHGLLVGTSCRGAIVVDAITGGEKWHTTCWRAVRPAAWACLAYAMYMPVL